MISIIRVNRLSQLRENWNQRIEGKRDKENINTQGTHRKHWNTKKKPNNWEG